MLREELVAQCDSLRERESVGEELEGGLRGHIFPTSVRTHAHTHSHIKEDLWKVEGGHR